VRLKVNDPLPSERADEETEVLAQAGVDFEVIPALRRPWERPRVQTRAA